MDRSGKLLVLISLFTTVNAELTPPYFNLAEGRNISATATCGVDTDVPERYCKLVGANTENEHDSTQYEVIQGQVCDYCDPNRPDKTHPPEYAIDGTENWWQSPPLSRGARYNEVNLTIDFGQEFHVAYIFIRMGNSPRPGLWTLEKSNDYGKTWTPWQHFSDSVVDCETYFGKESLMPIQKDNDVICTTEYSKIVPLENGEIPVTLLTGRPSANDYFNSPVLQEWTRATNVRIRLMRTKNLLGHLMSVARQDPTVTRRYFYSIKDISIGGRCVCNGHASTCSLLDPRNQARTLACTCQHHTCGIQCDQCCPGFEQKKWRQNTNARPFQCEPCNCHGHSVECEYNAEVDEQGLSLDIHGNIEGGGVCKNCQHNTEGINCNKCKPTFYRPFGKYWNETDVCSACNCDSFFSTGNCEEGTGRCECRKEFQEPDCTSCSYGHFGYPNCRPCECNLNGTNTYQCEPKTGGNCDCKYNFGGEYCKTCAEGFYEFPNCIACECDPIGSSDFGCELSSGQCLCKTNFGGKQCNQCAVGYYNFPQCKYCSCDIQGTVEQICDQNSGSCICREGFGGSRCDQCIPGYYGYPNCVPCNCSVAGSISSVCDASGRCPCLSNFGGRQCTSCNPGYYSYPECLACNCDPHGSIGISCNSEGQCLCEKNFNGKSCNECGEGFYNFPACEECNCDPAGVIAKFAGCGSVPAGELCQCKERVQGRICDQCRPLYWNLNASNLHGCEECDCFIEGTIGALDSCDTKTGQCVCKPSVTGRNCGQCKDGSFDLFGGSLFGCKDCGCNIGGSASLNCDKISGQCRCHPRISGRTCSEPLTTHYYPTLYQFQFEYEDGFTQDGAQVKYKYEEKEFPDFSKKGYVVFTTIQNEILNEVNIQKSSVYRLVIRYINPTNENIIGDILIKSDNPSEEEQKAKVLFKQSKTPQLVTVSGSKGEIPSPVVLDPGRYEISITSKRPNLLLDYFVLLPAAYYEASILTRSVENSCEIGNFRLCRQYKYPSVSSYTPTYEPFIIDREGGNKAYIRYKDFEHLSHLEPGHDDGLPLLTELQPHLNYMIEVKKHGKYVLLVDYVTERNFTDFAVVQVNQQDEPEQDGFIMVYPCATTTTCRAPVSDGEAREKIFFIDVSDLRPIEVKLAGNFEVAIKSVTAIPYEEWSTDYIRPSPFCIFEDGSCIPSTYRSAPEARTIEFANEISSGDNELNVTKLVLLDSDTPTISISSKVPSPGRYAIILGFNQPHHPKFKLQSTVKTENQVHNGKIEVEHCPAISGCRALIRQDNGYNWFDIENDFTFNITNPHKTRDVFLNYLLVTPLDQYSETLLHEDTYDQTKEFIHRCGHDNFYISLNASDFCKQAVFSLTADYNSGALPCQCDYHGSTSFECELFGGQCQCKQNVIGRQCDACRTGFYGFPDCKPCNCPANNLCEKDSGACICPKNVEGDQCDKCKPYTYDFDAINGCSDCNCHPEGVNYNDLQCNVENGTCNCRRNIIGRTCSRCAPGYFNFPHCEKCDCNTDGTTFDICDEVETCLCKKHTIGRSCDRCKDGYFNLQSQNPEGCTKCFCFGKTSRCDKAYLRPFNVSMLNNVTLNSIAISNGNSEIQQLLDDESILVNETSLRYQFPEQQNTEISDGLFYFGMLDFLLNQNNHLTAYGEELHYDLLFSNGPFGSAIIAPDVVLKGKTLTIVHQNYEQPAARQLFRGSVGFTENNFETLSGASVTREQFMLVLRDLEAVYIRASYWENSIETLLSNVYLTMADEDPDAPHSYQELAVERCECPPGYQGLSCEDCAPGYYRDPDGPFGGYCIPCDCHGHARTCDCQTGKCHDCDHFTRGDHCESCIEGYYGNATNGSPYDCMICACPLPIESNNFAFGCEVSEDGLRIRCDCKPGYNGEKCQSCAPGFFGNPQIEGEICKPCDCSGNIDPHDPSSCDSVSGECLRCLNNTFGAACNLCAPGFFGDAINLKDCQTCVCDPVGTESCDSYTGICKCLPNVIGAKCDRCEDDHYGFESGYGCQLCNCGEASNSTQCDDSSGQCACKPGVTGKYCDRCLPGYWNYSPDGCEHCKCNTDYSRGLGCDANTGQCQCLPGVIGEKCDRCPNRWVLIQDSGCFECDACHHGLLDVTDALQRNIDEVKADFDEASKPYFTARKLDYYNDTIESLKPEVESLDPRGVNLTPFSRTIEKLILDGKNIEKRVNYSLNDVVNAISKGSVALGNSNNAVNDCRLVNSNVRTAVKDVQRLAYSFDQSGTTKIDTASSEAASILDLIKQQLVTNEIGEQIAQAEKALQDADSYNLPVQQQIEDLEALKVKFGQEDSRIEDLFKRAAETRQKTEEADFLNSKNKRAGLQFKFDTISNQTKHIQSSLREGQDIIGRSQQTFDAIHLAHQNIDKENANLKDTNNAVDAEVHNIENKYAKLDETVREARLKADELDGLADFLDKEYSNGTSNVAIKAARVYEDIVDITNEAKEIANASVAIAQAAYDLTNGIGIRAGESDQNARDILSSARIALKKVQAELQPSLTKSSKEVNEITEANAQSDDKLLAINFALDSIPIESHAATWKTASKNAQEAQKQADNALNTLKPINKEIPDALTHAREIPKEINDINKSFAQVKTHLERVNQQLPEILVMEEDLRKVQDVTSTRLSSLGENIDDLKKHLKQVREAANAVKVGLTFYPNTTLELKPPEDLAVLSSTKASVYFKTEKPNGFLFYLGNEGKTSRRPQNDDFMELELENGYPVLNVDLGNGPEKIIGKKYVADNKWYQAIVDRSGKNVKLIIRDENDEGEETFAETPYYELSGDNNLFHWDENSRIFVGGYPPDYKMQDSVKYNSFTGEMENFKIGDTDIGFWNFVDGQSNTDGAEERDRLLTKDTPVNGLRFGGNGFVAIDAKSFSLSKRSSIGFRFKTSRDVHDGLLFYAGNNENFLSLELREGDVVFQFKLGPRSETIHLKTSKKFNDDQWHKVLAEREGNIGVLHVDDKQFYQEEDVWSNTSAEDYLDTVDVVYFGGTKNAIPHKEVTSTKFDGCIEEVTVHGLPVDLTRNVETYDVRPGCPVKFSTILSYKPIEYGHLKTDGLDVNNNLNVNLKFRTREPDGLIFFITDNDQAETVSLSLDKGILVLRSNRVEVNSGANRFDDGEWHVVTASHDTDNLRLSIDDNTLHESDETAYQPRLQNGDIYFGGVPRGFRTKSGVVSTDAYFVGCISDVTINSNLVNFAVSIDRHNAILDQCSRDLFDYDPSKLPTFYPSGKQEHKASYEPNIDSRFDENLNEIEDEKPEKPTQATIPPTKKPRPTKPPKEESECALPAVPALETDFDAGWRFGTSLHSNIQFNVPLKKKKKNSYEFTFDFKTDKSDGLLFYAKDQRHTDFVAVYLKNGTVFHVFNCGSGTSNISSSLAYNDNEWHTVKFARQDRKGRLLIDNSDEKTGESTGNARTMQLVPPFYFGGIAQEDVEDAALNLKTTQEDLENHAFFGCIRNILADNAPIDEPSNINQVQPCSESIEPGVFFEGGYVKLREKFKVGTEVTIQMDIKPRTRNGFILSVHGKKAYLILQLVNGTIQFSVDNGEGAFTAIFKPEGEENFCDGNWRTITATKSKYVLTVQVNNVVSEPAIGTPSSLSTDTTRPLFLGGHPHIKKIRGLTIREPYRGCIRNLKIRGAAENISVKQAIGDVKTGVCPLN